MTEAHELEYLQGAGAVFQRAKMFFNKLLFSYEEIYYLDGPYEL